MPDWFNEVSDVPVVLAIVTAALTVIMYVVKREVTAVKHEVFPNSGKSLRDAVDRIESKLDAHITWHLDNREQ